MWDEKYDAPGYLYGTEPNGLLAEHRDIFPGRRILCLGEGEGRNAVFLAAAGYRVTAIDSSTVGRRKALELAAEQGVELDYRIEDLVQFDPGREQWDGVVSIFCHLPAAARGKLHGRVVESLAPGGVFLLEAFTPDQLGRGTGGPSRSELLFGAADLERELVGLEPMRLVELERDVVEGSGHTGGAAVVQMIGRKPGGTA